MTAHIARIVRLCAAGVLATFPFCAAPAAFAVMPPAVDDSMLPKPRPPAPPRPTKQQERCVATPPTRVGAADGGQLKGLDLKQVWKFTRGTGQTVAVIDTGVARHRLLPHLVPGGDYVYTADGTDDCDGQAQWSRGLLAQSRIQTDRRSAASHPTPRSSAFVNRATNSAPQTIRPELASEMWIRLPAPSALLRTWARP